MIRCTASGAVHARIKELDIMSQTSLMTGDLSKRETKAVVFTFLECAVNIINMEFPLERLVTDH